MMTQRDHRDPIWMEGIKEETDYEQLVCGLDIPLNWRHADISDNSRKSDRFLPFRLVGDAPPPCEAGDVALFLVDGEWVEMEWLGERWFDETTRTGRFHQARLGRSSVERGDGFIGFRDTLTDEERADFEQRRVDRVREEVESGRRWGWMVASAEKSEWSAAGGAVSGPKAATERNAYLRTLTKIITKGGMTIRCDPGVIATRICEQILAMDPDVERIQPKDIHTIWGGKMSKGWVLADIW